MSASERSVICQVRVPDLESSVRYRPHDTKTHRYPSTAEVIIELDVLTFQWQHSHMFPCHFSGAISRQITVRPTIIMGLTLGRETVPREAKEQTRQLRGVDGLRS